MRVLSLDIQQFGALHGRRFATDADTVVVYGRNERGKSSFHHALRTALFGFSPAAAKQHPFASPLFHGSADPAEALLDVSATVRSRAGVLTIERRMDAALSSRLTLGGAAARDASFVRSNEPIQGIGAVTAGLFDEVYTLDPDSTRAFDQRLAPNIERLLMGGGALPDLPSVRQLTQAVDAERAALWRDDRRSKKTAVALLDARLAELQAEGRATRSVEEGLLRLETQLGAQKTQLALDEEALVEIQERIAHAQAIERVAQIARSAQHAGVDLDPLEGVPLESPVPMLADLEDAELALEQPVQRLSQPAATLDPSDPLTLEHREAILGLAREEARIERARTEAKNHAERALEKRAAARELERALRSDANTAPMHEASEHVGQLRALAVEWDRRALQAGEEAGSGVASPAKGMQWSVGLAAGAAAGGAALGGGAHWAGALAGAVVAAVAPAAAASLNSKDNGRVSSGRADAPRELRGVLERLGIAPTLVATPSDLGGLAATLGNAAVLRAEACDLEAAEEKLLAGIETEYARWRGMLGALVPDASRATWASEEDVPSMLRAHLEGAAARIREHDLDGEERRRAEQDRDRARARLQGISERFETLREALEAAVPGETVLERSYQRVAAAHAARERAHGALRELRESGAPSPAQNDPRMADAWSTGTFDASELRVLRDEAADLEEQILRGREEIARLDERLGHERPARTRSSIDSEAQQLREKRVAAMTRHRELTELSHALAEGERRHRAAHQPAILSGAGRWLEAITDGRYRSLAVDTSNGTSLTVMSRETGDHVPCEPPLSRGVREQVHLALRLGVADAADEGGEALPLLLDEALVHWDETRRAGLYRAFLARNATRTRGARQVFLFTCHETLADEAAQQLGALRIDL